MKIADIGRDELVQGLGIVSKRIPAWLLSDADLQAAGVSPARRNILRPDIMLVESSHSEQVACASTATIEVLGSQVDYHVPKALQPRLPKGSRRPPEADRPLQGHAAPTYHMAVARRLYLRNLRYPLQGKIH